MTGLQLSERNEMGIENKTKKKCGWGSITKNGSILCGKKGTYELQ
jgi:hypothetical protein